MTAIIEVDGLGKQFGETTALDGVSFEVEEGTVVGLLGPNGAGKTTAIRVLATLLAPDAGSARIGGLDVTKAPDQVRSIIGLTGQYAAVDEKLSGTENLEMVARLLGSTKPAAAVQAAELLDRFGLSDAGGRLVGTYSGGMRRRVDLAVSLVGRPKVLFLDEPTTGLDPSSRLQLWEIVRELIGAGTTVLLTTQYLEEADELADRIIVINQGTIIEEGTGDEVKDRVGGRTLDVTLVAASQLDAARDLAYQRSNHRPLVDAETRTLSIPVGQDTELAAHLVGELNDASIPIEDFRLQRPSLDQVFLALTGRSATNPTAPDPRPKATRA